MSTSQMSGPPPSSVLLEEPKSRKQWTCNQCKRTFPQSKLLETHAADKDHKAYRCTKEKDCGKSFILRPSWIRHEGSHSGQKTHACFRCQKMFRRKDNCHDHERTRGRVARRARVSSQSASTSPTISDTTTVVTPIGLFTNVADGGNQCHTAATGREGLLSLDTSVVSQQIDNGNDDEHAVPSLPGRPTDPSPTATAAYFSTTSMVPTLSRSATLHDLTAAYPFEAEHNTDSPPSSPTSTSQFPIDINWLHTLQLLDQETPPSPPQQHAEDWDFTFTDAMGLLEAPSSSMGVSMAQSCSGPSVRDDARRLVGHVDDHFYNSYNGFKLHADSRVSNELPPVSLQDHASQFVTSDSATHIPLPKPERKPRSKIVIFFSKLKACIKAPFRRHK